MNENRLPDYLDHMQQAATDASRGQPRPVGSAMTQQAGPRPHAFQGIDKNVHIQVNLLACKGFVQRSHSSMHNHTP